MLRALMLLSALISFSSPVLAQQQLVLDTLRDLNAKGPQPALADLNGAVAGTAKAFAEANKTCVPKSVKLSDVAPITGARGIMAAVMAGRLRNAWTVYAEHIGCSDGNLIRYMVLQSSDGSLKAVRVNEGRTFANPVLMRDTSLNAALAALQKGKSLDATCTGRPMKMGPTRVTSQSADLGPEIYGVRYVGKWTEIWQFETCGKKFDVSVEFSPDGDGGAYTNVVSDQVVVVR
jgi:hypothetical protein